MGMRARTRAQSSGFETVNVEIARLGWRELLRAGGRSSWCLIGNWTIMQTSKYAFACLSHRPSSLLSPLPSPSTLEFGGNLSLAFRQARELIHRMHPGAK